MLDGHAHDGDEAKDEKEQHRCSSPQVPGDGLATGAQEWCAVHDVSVRWRRERLAGAPDATAPPPARAVGVSEQATALRAAGGRDPGRQLVPAVSTTASETD